MFARSLVRSAIVVLNLAALPQVLRAQKFKKEVLYQIITDRFFDGAPTNKARTGSDLSGKPVSVKVDRICKHLPTSGERLIPTERMAAQM